MFGFIALILSFISITFMSLWIRQKVFYKSVLYSLQENGCAFCAIDDGRIVFSSDNLAEILGITDAKSLDCLRDFYAIMSPEDIIKLENTVSKVAATGESLVITIKTHRWIKVSGSFDARDNKVLLFFENVDESMVQDIHKNQQIKLLKNQLKFRDSVLDSIPTLIWHRDFQQKKDVHPIC